VHKTRILILDVLKGKAKTVFTKLQKNLWHGLKGAGCAGHIFHNAQAATDFFAS
jgi:hypothetical protein